MSSCSNEPDHPSDAVEDHSRGQDSHYWATTLSSFFCSSSDTQSPFFSSPLASSRSFLQSSNVVPFFFPAPSSVTPPSWVELHQCQPPCPILHTPHSLETSRPCIPMQQWWGTVTTRRLIQLCQKSRIRSDCTISRQPPFSHYICNPSLLKRLSPSASFSQEEHKRSGGLDEISPIDCHLHLE